MSRHATPYPIPPYPGEPYPACRASLEPAPPKQTMPMKPHAALPQQTMPYLAQTNLDLPNHACHAPPGLAWPRTATRSHNLPACPAMPALLQPCREKSSRRPSPSPPACRAEGQFRSDNVIHSKRAAALRASFTDSAGKATQIKKVDDLFMGEHGRIEADGQNHGPLLEFSPVAEVRSTHAHPTMSSRISGVPWILTMSPLIWKAELGMVLFFVTPVRKPAETAAALNATEGKPNSAPSATAW